MKQWRGLATRYDKLADHARGLGSKRAELGGASVRGGHLGLGTRRVADRRRPDASGWVVLADLEGNALCILQQISGMRALRCGCPAGTVSRWKS